MTKGFFRSICLASALVSGICFADECVVPAHLTQVSSIQTVSGGVAKILALAAWAESQDHGCPSQEELQASYARAHNLIFIRTHIVRLQSAVESPLQVSAGSDWADDSREAILQNHHTSLRVFESLEQNLNALQMTARGVLISDRIWNGLSLGSSFLRIEGLPQLNSKSSGRMMGFQVLPQQESIVFDVGSLVRILRQRQPATPFSIIQSSDSAVQELHLNLNLANVAPRELDLSGRFDRPESQILQNGIKTFACAGFALGSALEFLFDQFPRLPLTPRFEVSPWHTYTLMQSTISPDSNCSNVYSMAAELKNGNHIFDGVEDLGASIQLFTEQRRCVFESRTNTIQIGRSVSITNRNSLHPELIRKILHREKPILAVIRSEARIGEDHGQWYNIVRGQMRHALLIVGYGNGLNPFTLSEQPYFIVRDSMATQPIHYKVDAHQLIQYLDEAHVILEASIRWF